ncbi:MAG: aminotransferase class III-fold pyridoxal phosphate-dependent enzyme, partial [Candidatus Nanohaloarchaea archaeon]|nr:aminotransferase class III-fold pyridoxal phosphate-dependent enzyme [Candidatus Nanohaloarchaea archaeon]
MDAAERYERHVGKPGYYQHVTVEETEGNHLVGPDGTRYIDFIAGWCVVNAGYGRDRIIDRMTRHAEQAAYTKPTYIDDRTARLAERLADLAPGRLRQTFRVP